MTTTPSSVQDNNLRGMAVSSISLVTFTIGANLVLLRMYVRINRHITGWDDYAICVALALSLLGTVVVVYQVANGAGRHMGTLTPAQLSGFIKWTFVEGVEFVIGTCFVKISVCVFILRFINKTRRAVRYFIYVIMAFLTASTLGLVIALLAQCRPLRALYVFEIKGKCYSKSVSIFVAYVQAAINVLTDFTCAGLPFFVVRKLQIRRSLRIGLSIVMGLEITLRRPLQRDSSTACFSILRIAFLYTNYAADVTYANLVNIMFAVLELNLGIIAASIATIRPLFASPEQSIDRLSSDNVRGRYKSDQPLVGHYPKAAKAGSQSTGILMSPITITNATDLEITQDFEATSEERV